jgi:hypothetical protein
MLRNVYDAFINIILGFVTDIFSSLSINLETYGLQSPSSPYTGTNGLNYMEMARDYGPIFVTVGMGLLILLWGISIMQTTISTELFTMKGAVKTFGRFFVSLILMGASGTICVYILEIGASITSAILEKDVELSFSGNAELPPWSGGSSIPIVGEVVDFLASIITLIPLLLMLIIVMIAGGCVVVKLLMRTFQIAILITVSPCFFACTVSEASIGYFRKFISAFLATTFEVVFMALIYAAGKVWLNNPENSFLDHPVQWTVLVIAMCAMMIKPPQFLKSLV